jgi:hypothetical protein
MLLIVPLEDKTHHLPPFENHCYQQGKNKVTQKSYRRGQKDEKKRMMLQV